MSSSRERSPAASGASLNRKNIQKVRDVIAGLPPKRFSMARFATPAVGRVTGEDAHRPVAVRLVNCGTAGCIAGWSCFLFSKATVWGAARSAANALGLSNGQAEALFMPVGYSYRRYTRPHAVRVLDHPLATGEVDWKSTRRAKKAVAK